MQNSNGHQKAFELTQPKTPEQVARENVNAQMPKNRRAVSQLNISAQAKWLFAQISDDSFMFEFGGNNYGSIVTSITKLSDRYQHDRDSIAKWLHILEAQRVVWTEHEWPNLVIHISAAVPSPKTRAASSQRVSARASRARIEANPGAEGVGTPFFAQKPKEPASNAEGIGKSCGDVPARHAEGVGKTCPQLPQDLPTSSAHDDRQHPHTPPTTPAPSAGTYPHVLPTPSASLAEDVGTRTRFKPVVSGKKAPGERSPETGKGKTGEKSIKRSTVLNAIEPGAKSGKKALREKVFLLDVAAVMDRWKKGHSKYEMTNSGAWWRLAWRKDADLIERVLADVLCQVKESKIGDSPGAAAVDLWKRWGGGDVKETKGGMA